MITSDIQELNISDLNEYKEDRSLLLTENEKGYWRKLTLDPNKSVTGTGSPFAYQDNEIISTTNVDESYNNRVSDGTDHIDMYYDFSSGIPTWGLQTSDSGTFRWEPDDRRNAEGSSPKISADSQGNAWIIFEHQGGDNIRVIYYDSTVNDWTTATVLDNMEAPTPSPDIAMSESGISIAAWVHDTGLMRQIQAAFYDPATTTWTSNIDLSIPTSTEDANPQVAINDNGDGVAVWQSPQSDGSIVVQAALFFSATKTWQGFPTTIGQTPYEGLNPRVGIDNSGNILVVWEEYNPFNNKSLILYNSYDAGTSTWGSPLQIPSSLNHAFLPELSVTSSGNAMVVWIEEGINNSYNIEANQYNGLTKTWNTVPYTIDTITNHQYPAKVAMSNLGTAVVAYSKKVSGITGEYYIWASKYNPDVDAWETPEILDQTTIENSLPDVDINDSGNMVAVWVKNIETNVVLHSSTYQEVIKKWSLPDQISSIRSSFSSNQVIVINDRAASIYQATTIPGLIVVTGAVATINPNIMTANDEKVSFSFRKVQEVGEPEVDTDAATKFYVDTAIAAATGVFLEQLQAQGLLKEGALEALNKKSDSVREGTKKTKKSKK